MSNVQSPYVLTKQLEADVLRLLSLLGDEVSVVQEQTVRRLKHALVDARLEAQDYELAETRAFQLENKKALDSYLATVQAILASNIIEVFSAVDIAQLSARTEYIQTKVV